MLIVVVLVLAGFLHVAETPTCRVDPSVSVDSRCTHDEVDRQRAERQGKR